MNSYPHEVSSNQDPSPPELMKQFLSHPRPLMFVAGLTPSRDRSASTASGSGQRSRAGSTVARLEATHGGPALTTPIASPNPVAHASLPISPPATSPPIRNDDSSKSLDQIAGPSTSSAGLLPAGEDEFELLIRNMREALEGLGGKGKVWVNQKERRDFRILLVDKHVRLPMRKVNPSPAGSQGDLPTPHSPLSPLTPTSPSYPDGLIAPIWVHKHAERVPSVFLLFLRLYESPPDEDAVEDILGGNEARDAQKRAKEHEMDEALVKEIGDRRRRLGERGIKLTVVLMASAAALDSPSLDPRLSYLRRASVLSSKASLFVLSPVPAEELPEFVQSIQDALYDSAMEYYSTHAKRVKRKRARVSTNSLAVPGAAGKVLGGQGWAVRYDWKSGWFAEIRGDFEEARRHYEDCWNELARMFSSTQTLPPRTKRWSEAKVLADCVAMRICRLLLYGNDSAKVLGPFYVHLKRFSDLSRGWGIGEETFEFWSWLARQIPTLASPILPTAQSAATPPTPEYWSTPISAGNPLQSLQSPAFYFYTAASCSVQRQTRFKEALVLEENALASDSNSGSGYVSTAPGFANEKKVDHTGLIIELFTKAYSLLKEQDIAQTRMALYVAYRIAESYCESGQHDMAMRFFERISTTFQRDRWSSIVRQIRKLWYECAQTTGHVDSAARLLVEMMCPDSGIEGEDRAALPEDLMSLLKTTSPASEDPIILDMGIDRPLLSVRAGFWHPESSVSSSVPFQISIGCPEGVQISELIFSSAVISFSDGRPDYNIEGDSSTSSSGSSLDIGTIGLTESETSVKTSLSFESDRVLVLQGEIKGDSEGMCEISTVRLNLIQGTWDLQLVFTPEPLSEWTAGEKSFVPPGGISSSVNFIVNPHMVELALDHLPSGFVSESMPVKVTITSKDERDLQLHLSVFLHPGEEEEQSSISNGDVSSDSLLRDLDLGVLKNGETIEKIINLKSSAIGTKVLDFSLQTTLVDVESTTPMRSEEFEATSVIPIMAPFGSSSRINYSAPVLREDGLVADATISTIITGNQLREIEVESIDLIDAKLEGSRMKATSLSINPFVSQKWDEHTVYSIVSKYEVRPSCQAVTANISAESSASLSVKWRSHEEGEFIETSIPLPPLTFPLQQSFLAARLSTPRTVNLQTPFPIVLSVINSHPTHSIADVSINVDISDTFVWMGSRSGRLKDIPPNSEREVRLECVPVSRTGMVELPKVRVYEGFGEGRREIAITGSGVGKGGVAMVFVQP